MALVGAVGVVFDGFAAGDAGELRGGPAGGFDEDGGFGAVGLVVVEGLEGAGDSGGVAQGDVAFFQGGGGVGEGLGEAAGQVDAVGGGAGGEAEGGGDFFAAPVVV